MLIITSPSKSQHIVLSPDDIDSAKPLFLDKTEEIVNVLKNKSLAELQELLNVSENLAELSFDRYQHWQPNHTQENSNPALFTYNGDIYQKMSIADYSLQELTYAQQHVRIVSGLYGLLRPLDLMQPYRLEMNTDLEIHTSKDLYSFWRTTLTNYLNKYIEEKGYSYLINLASQQYSDVIDFDELSVPVITIEFKEKKGNKLTNIAIYLKYARGMMLDYCIRNEVTSLDEIKNFSLDDYYLLQERDNVITFIR